MRSITTACKKLLDKSLEQLPRGHLIAIASLSSVLFIAGALSPSQETPSDTAQSTNEVDSTTPASTATSSLTQSPAKTDLQLLDINSILQIQHSKEVAENINSNEPKWKEEVVASGDNLSNVFSRVGMSDRDIYELFDGNKSAKDLRSIAPGQKIAFLIDNNGKLQELKYVKNSLNSLRFTRNKTGFTSQEISLKPEIKHAYREGVINSSLFIAGKQAGLPNTLTMELANIFGWDVDFALDIQKGDEFRVMYEEQFLDGKRIGIGAILSAEFVNAGKTYRAVRYTSKEGVTRYYAPDGKGMNKAFLRTPVDFARISSSFSLGRLHPVLNTIRAHKGTDYAASTGTPIRSTGDGKIIFAGRQGGYGNCIVIQHGQGYETLYGHMNSFAKGISTGTRVSQGQVIGYVGMTGLATGPHLHYEFHMNGQVRDPVTVPLPQSMGIAANEKERFNAATKTLVAELDDFERNTRMAMSESAEKTKSN